MTAFAAIRWARQAPVVRRADGKPDSTAHHVLLALATWADKDGRARPSVPTLADATLLTDDTVLAALARLCEAKLVRAEGRFGGTGTEVWLLALELTRDSDEDPIGRRARAREKTAARVAKYRENKRAVTLSDTVTEISGNGVRQRDVTVSDGVTADPVTVSHTVGNGVPHRDVTVSHTVGNGADCVTPADHSPRTAIELPVELPLNCHPLPTAAERAKNSYPDDFEAFWIAYGRKGAKRTAAAEWTRATKRATVATIMSAVGPYVASRPDAKYRKDAERWLKGDCWESAVVPLRPAVNGYQPYQNPTDTSGYYEEF